MPADGHRCHKYGLRRGQCHLLGVWTRVAPVTIFCLLTQPASPVCCRRILWGKGRLHLPFLASCLLFTAAAKMKRSQGQEQGNGISTSPTVPNLHALPSMEYLTVHNVHPIILDQYACNGRSASPTVFCTFTHWLWPGKASVSLPLLNSASANACALFASACQ